MKKHYDIKSDNVVVGIFTTILNISLIIISLGGVYTVHIR